MKFYTRFGLVAALGLALSGCALANVASGPAPQLFTLTAPGGSAVSDILPTGPSLLVDEPSASASIDTARIAFQPNPNELKYYADARWTDLVPTMVQALAVQTLQSSGSFASVAARGSEIRGDYMLKGDIRQFAAEQNGEATQVRIDIFMRLVSRDTRSVIAVKDFSATAPLDGKGMSAVVASYDKALSPVLSALAKWTADEIAKQPAVVAKK